jgi:hypothetical protein
MLACARASASSACSKLEKTRIVFSTDRLYLALSGDYSSLCRGKVKVRKKCRGLLVCVRTSTFSRADAPLSTRLSLWAYLAARLNPHYSLLFSIAKSITHDEGCRAFRKLRAVKL